MTPQLQTVHVRVTDASTRQPTPARVRFTDADGAYYAPLGRLADFATEPHQDVGGSVRLGTCSWAYVPGSFEIKLPPGTVHVEIHKGPEYRALAHMIQLNPGKLALRFTIERWIDLPARGWYSGDGRAHCLSPHAALLEARAEDVHVVNLLAAPTRGDDASGRKESIADLLAFSGQGPALEATGYVVVVNTHNTHPVLGSLGLLNCHRVVYPLTFGGPGGADDWTLADWCDQCHRKNGLVVWTRIGQENSDLVLGEALIDLLLGKVDALEIDHGDDGTQCGAGFQPASCPAGWKPAPHLDVLTLWYDLLEAGLRVPLIGSSAKNSNANCLGSMRTFGRLQPGEEFNYRTWIEAVRGGRTFVSNGPVLLLTVNNQGPGAVLQLDKPGMAVHVHAEIQSQAPVQSLEILLNGNAVAATDKTTLDVELPIHETGWLAARCRGPHNIRGLAPNKSLFGHTSPVYLQLDHAPDRVNQAAAGKLLFHIDEMEAWVRHKSKCSNDHERNRFLALARAAREKLIRGGYR